jgi:HlyD family secretion protein
MSWRRHIGLTILTLFLAALLVYGFWPQPRPVEVAAVTRAPLQVTVEEEGKTRVIDRYVVSAPVAGYARRIDLQVGDTLHQGQVLLLLEPLRASVLDPRARAQAQANVGAAEAAVRAAEQVADAAVMEARLADTELRRIRDLRRKQLVPQADLDRAETRAHGAHSAQRSAEFAQDVANHELEVAHTALQYSAAQAPGKPAEQVSITAPVNGRVLKLYHESEGVVGAGEALIEIGDPTALEVEVEVLSSDAVRITPGMRVQFERWGGDGVLEGRVRQIEPAGFTKISALGVEEQRVRVIADITTEAQRWARLGDGYRIEARFILWRGDNVLQVPASALFRYQGGWAVFAVDGGRARRRGVLIGERNGLAAQVLKGVDAGVEVITHPDDTIDDGVRVERR